MNAELKRTELKRKVAFALTMGIVTTGIVSFVLIAVNVGFSPRFAEVWLRSWAVGYVLVIPAILLIGPRVQALVDRVIPAGAPSVDVLRKRG